MNPADTKCFDGNPIGRGAMQHTSELLGCSSSESSRSAGDGGSESNYATLNDKNCTSKRKQHMLCEDDEEEESHYSLIRKPDGQADEGNYITMRLV